MTLFDETVWWRVFREKHSGGTRAFLPQKQGEGRKSRWEGRWAEGEGYVLCRGKESTFVVTFAQLILFKGRSLCEARMERRKEGRRERRKEGRRERKKGQGGRKEGRKEGRKAGKLQKKVLTSGLPHGCDH